MTLWRNRELRQHIRVIDGSVAPSIVLTNATYLNVYTNQWIEANIWIYEDRIVYVGEKLPQETTETEFYDCQGKFVVPGYIEPHSHPFQAANPEVTAMHAAKTGTTTMVNDNLTWHLLLNKKKTFSIIGAFSNLPVSMFWWNRFDGQTTLKDDRIFNTRDVLDWAEHPLVIQGGELTDWPSLLTGGDRLLYWMQEMKKLGKPIEGHLPGASSRTLTKMKLFGITSDHESMTAGDVLKRLELGYRVSLRYSPIRPDLPDIIRGLLKKGLTQFDNMSFTMDGPTPAFMKDGMINVCIEKAIEQGLPVETAYRMASYHPARHFNMEEEFGSITPGRVAHVNILSDKQKPHPESVIGKGKWIKKDGEEISFPSVIDWEKYDITPLEFDWELQEEDLQFSSPIGMDMVNDVIIQPYTIVSDVSAEEIPAEKMEQFITLIDKKGEWRVNTIIRGFAPKLGAIVSSFSATGDIILIGNSKKDIRIAEQRMKELGGGIVLVDKGKILTEMPLPLGGVMSDNRMEELIQMNEELKKILAEYGYAYQDPIYSLLFLSAFHLPFFRITQQGLLDVKKRDIIIPATMR
ncbi:adenine deaminase C-terminal domain-containing protein [Oceanobacillus sp. J11TS1]|uniref:adenine deaminase C-terminal domain-containing protein n=1 Tax=Oceanobacillus sp. J11TS1 TaxID=2807191 RepID=UPI001B0A07EA|nr:adenine deaminase C-terminal domain-containing protein [Oceanobacillus sp. J11TS1]GIO22811.1 putative adenine deaminase [Oceanobacillus sp. J11TS1]